MDPKERHIELFDKYVLGNLTKAEEKELSLLIKDNPELELEFKTHKLLADGIKLARKEELKDYLKEHGKVEYFQNIWGKKWRSASAVIVLLFTCSFFMVQYLSKKAVKEMTVADKEDVTKTEEPKEQSKNSTFEENSTKENDQFTDKSENVTQESTNVKNLEIVEDDVLAKMEGLDTNRFVTERKDDSYFEKPVLPNKTKELNEEYKELPIVEEKKLFDTTLVAQTLYYRLEEKKYTPQATSASTQFKKKEKRVSANDKSTRKEEEFSENLKDKLTTDTTTVESGDAEELEVKPITISIEFWLSPLNFKGYQYLSVLKLYGVKEESVSIIQYNNILFLKVNDQYCKLIKGKEYLPFKFITDQNLINTLNGN